MRKITRGTLIGAGLTAIIGASFLANDSTASSNSTPTSTTTTSTIDDTSVASSKPVTNLEAFELECDGVQKTAAKPAAREHDENIRQSAQEGLNFLTTATLAWQEQNNCMGCHVQGVTAEALSVGVHHQYQVDRDEMQGVFSGILDLSGGIRTEIGHAAPGGSLRPSTRAFGGASLARYDMWVGEEYGDDLINAATDLLQHQGEAGEITQAYNTGTVAKGPLQGTYQAIQTWQQAYARTADDRWLTAIGQGEAYLQKQVDQWYATPTNDIQHLNYALLGLLAAGVGSTEQVIVDLRDQLLETQALDGGFPLFKGQGSSALVTGQSLYTMRRLGMNDSDEAVKKAVMYLVEAQQPDGGWSDTGAEKAEAMWAVLGLVSTDVLSVNVTGLKNGQHVGGTHTIEAHAVDNEGAGVKQIEIAVDDIRVWGSCASQTAYSLDASKLEDGMHTVDVTAINADGQKARRRLVVYAGDHYVVNVGSKYSDGGTLLSMRDIAPESLKHDVSLEILKDGKPIHSMKQPGDQGALSFHWKGETKRGETAKAGEYTARLRVEDAAGKVRQTHEMPFVHDTPEAQARNYGQVAGKVNFAADDADIQNATVELVDEQGNVVQRTRSTASGQYRFRNVKPKSKYKVRVKKKGWADKEAELAPAEEAEEAQVDFLF